MSNKKLSLHNENKTRLVIIRGTKWLGAIENASDASANLDVMLQIRIFPFAWSLLPLVRHREVKSSEP